MLGLFGTGALQLGQIPAKVQKILISVFSIETTHVDFAPGTIFATVFVAGSLDFFSGIMDVLIRGIAIGLELPLIEIGTPHPDGEVVSGSGQKPDVDGVCSAGVDERWSR
jgi:hypothetical protein